jgi:hypothetical protein
MKTKTVYCGDGWEFQIDKEDKGQSLSLKGKCGSVERWELEELMEFLKNYLENK